MKNPLWLLAHLRQTVRRAFGRVLSSAQSLRFRRMRTALLFTAVTFLVCQACSTKLHQVVPVTSVDTTKTEYFYYALPRTVLVAEIKGVVLQAERPPQCSIDATRLERLGLKIPPYVGPVFTVTKVELSKRSEPDPAQRYAIALDNRGTKSLGLNISSLGVPSKASSEASSTGIALATSAIKLAASVFGKAAVTGAGAGDDACDEIEADLLKVRGMLLDLYSSGSAGDSKEMLAVKEAKLLAQAKALESLFTGMSIGTPASILCEITSARTTALISWTMKGGPTSEAGDACRIPAELVVNGSATAANALANPYPKLTAKHTLSLEIDAIRPGLSNLPVPTGPTDDRSFYYRLPAQARVSVADKLETEAAKQQVTDAVDWTIPQLGTVASIPRLSAGGAIKINVVFNPETGALTEVATSRSGADSSALTNAIAEQVAARRAAEKAEAERDVELETLQRQQAVLEAMVAIQAAEATLQN